MATRPPRLKRPHTFFHVTSRGTNRWNLFLDDFDRQRFMSLLANVCDRYGIELHAYCLMGNHFHLVVYCEDPNLSAAMRDLKSRYAKYFNRRHIGTGSVFEAPFVEVPILSDRQLMTEIRYTHRNPFDLDPNVCLSTYRWSSHGIYLGLRPQPLFVVTRIGRELFGPTYQRDIERPRPSDKVQNRVGNSVTSPGDVTLGSAEDWSLSGILREVATAAGTEIADVTAGTRNGLIGVALLIAGDLAGFTSGEIAEPFGYRSESAVRMATKRARPRVAADPDLQVIFDLVVRRIRRAA